MPGVEQRDPSRPPGVLGGGFADPAYLLGEPHGGAPTGPEDCCRTAAPESAMVCVMGCVVVLPPVR